MIRGRDLDRFGAGFFYNGLSDELKSQGVVSLQDEYGVELFYNYAISAAVMLTADLQVVEPAVVNYDTAIIPGVRLQAIF
jgi:porin